MGKWCRRVLKIVDSLNVGRFPVKKSCRIAIFTTAVLSAMLILAPPPGRGQNAGSDEKAKAKAQAKAKRDAQSFENNASMITFYNREGKIVGTAGERAMYDETVLSPDRTR